jgi:adenylate cyclase
LKNLIGFFRRAVKKPPLVAGLGGILVFLSVMGLRFERGLEFPELAAYDLCIRWQPKNKETDPRIVLIEITEEDIHTLGSWPMTDETVARAMTLLLDLQPAAVGLDLFRDMPVPPGTETLKAVLSRNGPFVAVWKFGDDGVLPPPAVINAEQLGFNDVLVDPGGTVRRGLLFLDNGKDVFYSFSLRLALLFLKSRGIAPAPGIQNPRHLRLGNTTIPPFEPHDGGYRNADARGYQYLLDYRASDSAFRSFTLKELLRGNIRREAIKDKIVLIGVNAQSVKDFFYTPHSRGIAKEQQVPGIRLQAWMTDQILRFALSGHAALKSLSETQEGGWILLWSLFGGTMGLWARSAKRFTVAGSGGTIVIFAMAFLAFLRQWWIPSVPAVLAYLVSGVLITAYLSSLEKQERALLMQLFSKHVSKEVAETIWQERDQIIRHGRPLSRKLTVTSFFSDLSGFTSVSEKMDPQDLMEWLNTYMESMTHIIMDHGGVVDDYAGDGIKANFGAPLPRSHVALVARDAVNAVQCAFAMEKEMDRLNALWQEKGLPSLGMRVGIFTGVAVVGPLGSSKRMKYTTIGNTINIASRLESYDKTFAKEATCRILIGESTLRHLGDRFRTERIGEVALRGKEEKIIVYRVLGEKPSTANLEDMEERE